MDREKEALNLEAQKTVRRKQATTEARNKINSGISSSDESDMDVQRTTLKPNTSQKNLKAETKIPVEEEERTNELDTTKPNNNTLNETNIIRQGDEEIEQSEEEKPDPKTQKDDLDEEPEEEGDNTNKQESDTDRKLEEEEAEEDTQESDMDKRFEDTKTDRNKAESLKEEIIDRKETVRTTKPEGQRSKMIEAEPTTTTMIKKKPSIFSRNKSIKEDI